MTLSSGSMSVGVLAIFSGLLGAYGLRTILLKEEPAAAKAPAMVIIPLASTDLPEGRRVTLGDVALHRMSPTEQAKRKLDNASVMLSADQIIGRTLSAPVKQGEPFLTSSLFLEGIGPNVAEKLKPGLRAITVEVPKTMGGLTPPGTFVDVLFRSKEIAVKDGDGSGAIPETTITLFEGVEVLSVEQPRQVVAQNNNLDIRYNNGRMPPAPETKPMVTLAVTLSQANMLRTVEGRGDVSLIPRSAEDFPVQGSGPGAKLTLPDLLGWQAPSSFSTEIYRAGSRELRTFNGNQLQDSTGSGDAAAVGAGTSPSGL